jgi:geranylgeranyl pyrophosphate synthase
MLPNWYNDYKIFIEESITKTLDSYIQKHNSNTWLNDFREAIYYATNWGKKLRAILALEIYLSLSNKKLSDISYEDDIVKLCVAIECVHAYSLVHDDLPCMDNDEYRRGQLTTWNKYWEYQAVLVWDLLNTLCFEILSDISNPNHALSVLKIISNATGFGGMIWWQISDMYFEEHSENINYSDLLEVHNKKTWALIQASILCGIVLADKEDHEDQYKIFWKKLWLAFQIKDDLLDVEWSFEETGKSVWWESKWFVYFLWIEKTRQELRDLIIFCENIAKKINSEKLEFIVQYIENRTK